LAIDAAVADACGVLLGRIGRRAATADALIGATGVIHELTVVTRDVDHFKPLGVATHNPWRSKI
jgi:predicted nucleic acid-binding protein